MPKDQLPVVHSAETLDLKFPEAKDHITPEDASKTRTLITTGGVFTPDGKPYIPTSALAHLLATDKPGVNQLYNDLPNEDKMQDGHTRYIATPALNKEFSRRIQEPRDVYKIERLKDAEACVNAFRDNPELEKRRALVESHIRKTLPKLKQQMLKAENITACQVTGEPLQTDAQVHHIERQADQPSKSLDPDNLVLINKSPHQRIHDAEAHSHEALASLAGEENWPYRRKT
ncbi:HNH endonuclease [Cupriavidus pauculus]|uniref:HNH endonuclease n=1 Tax=Cupriavidus pauculus TaxID=82633 RepID=A0A5P2H3I9_9BURK|nr:HNH endonuclease [Cupriavidus pauculus]QET02562.1 HNH endonuclease [Cupriavidus pauculus]